MDSPAPSYLFILPWSLDYLGGVNQVVINLASEMRRAQEFEPLVLVTDWSAPNPRWSESHGTRMVRWRIRVQDVEAAWWRRLQYVVWELRFRRRFRRFCRRLNVKVINVHYVGPTAFSIVRLAKYVDPTMPVVMSFHGADLNSLSSPSPRAMLRWEALLRRVAAVVTCSSDLGRRLKEVVGNYVPTITIHNGINAELFLALKFHRSTPDRRLILSIGKFEAKKGQDVLIEAFATIAPNYPDANLALVGATDEALPRLRAIVTRLGLAERIQFFADVPHDEIGGFFSQATVFALPSRQEPFGIVILEAGAYSVPVVASRVGGVPEILSDGETGILVAPDDPVALASGIRTLLDSPTMAKAMGDRLHDHVIRNFTWTSAYRKYVALCNKGARGDL